MLIFVSISLLLTTLTAKNLTIKSSDRLDNFELLDVYISNDLAFIPAGLGGLNIVDISDPSNPQVLSNYLGSGCDWGRMYAWSVSGSTAYGVGRECGVHILDITNPSDPHQVGTYSDPNVDGLRYEHGETHLSNLYLSRHQHGIEVMSIIQADTPVPIALIPTDNAWASLAREDHLYIADGASGIKIANIQIPATAQVIAAVSTSGAAKDLAISGNLLFVAVGAAGVDMIDISDPENPHFISNYNTTGYASRVSSNDSLVAVSDWDDVEILAFSNNELTLVGYKNTGGRVMALAMEGDLIFSAEWENFTVMQYGQIPFADLDLNTTKIEFPRTANNQTNYSEFEIENNGLQTLVLLPETLTNMDFEIELNDYTIEPGASETVEVSYHPENGSWRGDLIFESTDPDEPSKLVQLTGNHPFGPMVGDQAPEFELDLVNDLGTLESETLRGRPVVLAFFTAW